MGTKGTKWGPKGGTKGTGIRDQGPGPRDQGPGPRDQGPGTRDKGPGTIDPQGARGALPQNPQNRQKSGKNVFLKGFGGKLAFPNASWVPYNPFGSWEIP